MEKKQYPENRAIKLWSKEGITFSIIRHSKFGYFCGYARFPQRPLIEQEYKGIATYVPVHGGITYAHQDKDGFVYGFDCGHVDDETNPRTKDLRWVAAECERMAIAIKVAQKYERQYLQAPDNEKKAKIIRKMHEELEKKHEIRFKMNFGTMVNLLFGKL